jgi:Flagellar motor protein
MSPRASHRIEETSSRDVPPWMLTYADTVTLLMTFFVMLMSFSTTDQGQFAKLRGALVGHLGIVQAEALAKDSLLDRRNMDASRIFLSGYENPPDYDPLSYMEQRFDLLVKESQIANALEYRLTEEGFEIHIAPGALFLEGSAEMTDGGQRALDLVARACRHLPHEIRTIGYSDPFYVEEYSDPMDLALDRAAAVCARLRERGVAAGRLSVGAFLPVGDGETAAYGENSGLAAQARIIVLRPRQEPVR